MTWTTQRKIHTPCVWWEGGADKIIGGRGKRRATTVSCQLKQAQLCISALKNPSIEHLKLILPALLLLAEMFVVNFQMECFQERLKYLRGEMKRSWGH